MARPAQIDPDGDLLLRPVTPPPPGYVDIELTDEQVLGLSDRTLVWDPETQQVVANPGYVDAAIGKANRRALERQALAAVQTNKTFLALANPTNAQILAQVKALTRQNNGLIRLLLERFEATD